MPATPHQHILAVFGPEQWTGTPARGAGHIFIGGGFLTFLVILFLMIFIEPLRNFALLVAICTLVGTIFAVGETVSRSKREKSFLAALTAQMNSAILEITGDPHARVSAGKLRELIERCGTLPLAINGVPGVVLKVESDRFEEKRITAEAIAPDYGLTSFDLLLAAEQPRKPDGH